MELSIAQIIKYEGDNSTFVWKHPSEDFNTSTQLIVHESQEAIFFMDGQALDLFGAGRYTLETENIPLIRKVINLPTGGQTPFHCEVYFINKTEQMAIRWGTDSKVQYLEPTYKFPISIGASGEMSLSVSDSRKLLIKLVGTEAFLGQAKLIQFFRAFLMTRVKTYIAQTMAANAINIFEADALIFILCCLAMVLTWIIPAGTFERVTEGTLTKVVAGTFQHVDSSPQTPWAMLQAIYQGFINSAGTIFLIFFCGASVAMVEESHALSDFFTWLARKLKGKEMLAIAILMYGLGLGNAAGAFANIGVALMPIGIVMSNAIGGDAFLAFLIIYYGLQSGFSIGFANPSILGVAQTMAEIPIFSGTNVRVVCCLANITFLYIVTMLYYRRIRKDPTKSLNYGSDFHSAFEVSSDKVDSKMTKRQILTAAVFLLGVVLCVGLTIACKWNAKKIASYFFGMMIVIGLVSGFSMNEISDKFIKGCKPMIYASFITGLASAIAVILNQGKVLDTIVYVLSIPLNQVGAVVGAGLMVVVNVIVNIFIPSGSGQAAVMIPLMTPIADLVGITRQVAVQAFQFGDGLCNLLTPLNGPMMGCLAMVGISFPKYIKWAFKYLMMNIGAAIVITMVLQAVGWVGF